MSETKHTDKDIIIWCAGLFDGEGWIYPAHTKLADRKSFRFQVISGITNTELRLLRPFKRQWGGKIRPRKGTKLSRKPLYEWRIQCLKMEMFLLDVLPYLRGAKRSKAKRALEIRRHIRSPRRRIRGRMLELSKRELQWRERKIKAL